MWPRAQFLKTAPLVRLVPCALLPTKELLVVRAFFLICKQHTLVLYYVTVTHLGSRRVTVTGLYWDVTQ